MKRAGQWLINFVAGVSLFLLIVLSAQWLRSNDWMGRLGSDVGIGIRRLTADEMALPGNEFQVWRWTMGGIEVSENVRFGWDTQISDEQRARLPGGGISRGEPSPELESVYRKISNGRIELSIRLPYWLLTLLTAAAPAAWWLLHRRHQLQTRQAQVGLCQGCGYDLRATPNECPECGTVPGKVRDQSP